MLGQRHRVHHSPLGSTEAHVKVSAEPDSESPAPNFASASGPGWAQRFCGCRPDNWELPDGTEQPPGEASVLQGVLQPLPAI